MVATIGYYDRSGLVAVVAGGAADPQIRGHQDYNTAWRRRSCRTFSTTVAKTIRNTVHALAFTVEKTPPTQGRVVGFGLFKINQVNATPDSATTTHP